MSRPHGRRCGLKKIHLEFTRNQEYQATPNPHPEYHETRQKNKYTAHPTEHKLFKHSQFRQNLFSDNSSDHYDPYPANRDKFPAIESKSCPQRPEKQQAGPEFNRDMCFPVGNGHGVKAIGGLGPPLQRSPDGSPRGRFEYGVRHDRGQRGRRSRPCWREPAAAQGKGHDDETPGCFTVRGTRASRGRAEGTASRKLRTGPVGTGHALAPKLARLIAGRRCERM